MAERLFDPQKEGVPDKTFEQLMKERGGALNFAGQVGGGAIKKQEESPTAAQFLDNYYSSNQTMDSKKRRAIGAPSLIDGQEKPRTVYWIVVAKSPEADKFFIGPYFTKEGADNRVKNTSGGFVTMFKTIEQDPEKVKREYAEYEGQI